VEVDVGNTQYIPVSASDYPHVDLRGKKWVAVPLTPRSAAGQLLVDPFNSPLTLDSPTEALATLSPIVTAIHPAGTTTVGGVSTQQFLLTVSSVEMQRFMQRGGPTDPTVRFYPIEVWIDGQNRVRQTRIRVYNDGFNVTNDYSHFGVAVDLGPPPASEAITYAEFEKQMCGYTSVPAPEIGLPLGCVP
jgi:hypothetical protein